MKLISASHGALLPGIIALLSLFAVSSANGREPLQSFEGCRYESMKGADGDSFLVKFPDGIRRVVRLYAVDCIEARIWDESDSRRLKEQRRYFGITNCRQNVRYAIGEAKRFGELAHREVESLLSRPFTVHTAFADGRGSGYHKRIYAFVTTADGKDLAEHLVSVGLARAFGVCRACPRGCHRDDLRAGLKDLEMRAAKLGLGVWALTDWSELPRERSIHRREEAELELAIDRAASNSIVDPNSAPRDELMTLPGIGETLALRIIENRPYGTARDMLRVKALGEATLQRIRPRLPEQLQPGTIPSGQRRMEP